MTLNLSLPSSPSFPARAPAADASGSGNAPLLSSTLHDFGLLLVQQMQGQTPAGERPGEPQADEDVGESREVALLAAPATAAAVISPPLLAEVPAAAARAGDPVSPLPDAFRRSPERSLAPADFSPSPRKVEPHSERPVLSEAEGLIAPLSGRFPETLPHSLAASRPAADPAAPIPATALAAAPLPAPQAAQFASVLERIDSRIGTREWQGELGQKVIWMVADRQQVAELHLNPPDLGPLQVVLSVGEAEASALFVSHHAAVREAIESALPRLREMMAQNGVNLGSVTVSADAFPQQSGSPHERQVSGRAETNPAPEQQEAVFVPVRRAGSGLVDTFA